MRRASLPLLLTVAVSKPCVDGADDPALVFQEGSRGSLVPRDVPLQTA
jgi:hypothetical protein